LFQLPFVARILQDAASIVLRNPARVRTLQWLGRMPGIFISYRREDSPGHAGRIFDRLRSRFGSDVVFMDVAAIEAGVDFVDVLHKAVGSCDALLAVIGPQWLSATQGGNRRLDDPRDFVRIEIAGALERNVRVLPVLVEGARVPPVESLPADLQALTRRQAIELRDARWDDDIERLVEGLAKFLKTGSPSPQPAAPRGDTPASPPVSGADRASAKTSSGRGIAIAAVAVLILAVAAALMWRGGLLPGSGQRTGSDSPGRRSLKTPSRGRSKNRQGRRPPSRHRHRRQACRIRRRPVPTPSPASSVDVPVVTGKTILEAREILRKAGFRFLIRLSGKSKEPGIVETQMLDEASKESKRVLLTAVPTSTVLVHVVKGDEQKADALVTYLKDEPSTIGSIVRGMAVAPRADGVGRVAYSEDRLAAQAEAIAKDASDYLARTGSSRTLHPNLNPRVARSTIIVNLYERAP
jgi:hypothetical protein